MEKRGGARQGAGRKPNPDKRVSIAARVQPATARRLDELKEATGLSAGQIIDRLVNNAEGL